MNPGSPPTSDGCGTRPGCHGGRATSRGGRGSRRNMGPTILRHRFKGYLALAFLMGSDQSRFGRLLEKLENDFTTGNDSYPKTLTDAYNMLLEWKDNP